MNFIIIALYAIFTGLLFAHKIGDEVKKKSPLALLKIVLILLYVCTNGFFVFIGVNVFMNTL